MCKESRVSAKGSEVMGKGSRVSDKGSEVKGLGSTVTVYLIKRLSFLFPSILT